MKKILIIDDSALMRRVMSDIINAESGMQVEDTAENGKIAMELLKNKKRGYDCILVDINMPRMDGLGFLEKLNEQRIAIPILIVSSIADRSTKETMRALELGAYDFVKKPDAMRGDSMNDFREQILQKIKCAFKIKNVQYLAQRAARQTRQDFFKPADQYSNHEARKPEKKDFRREVQMTGSPLNQSTGKIGSNMQKKVKKTALKSGGKKIIFIASSTGGPKALQSVVPRFPKNIGCPIVIVQHMPEGFTASLAERLNEMSACQVVEAQDGILLENGVVYVAKGGYQLSVEVAQDERHRLAVKKEAARNGLRPCADIFLESLGDSGYSKVFCAVLTGMGRDATEGLKQLKRGKDVYTVVQNEETCVVYGMPCAAEKAGVADKVADLQDIADDLVAALQQNGG